MNKMIAKPRARVTWTAGERSEWLHLFVENGQSAAEFCRDNGLSPATLSLWRQQIPQAGVLGDSLVEVPRQALQPTEPKSSVGACSVLELQVMNQAGVRTEKVWFNFTPDRVHWVRYAGRNHTHRQCIKRKAESWGRRYRALPPGERLAVLSALMAIEAE